MTNWLTNWLSKPVGDPFWGLTRAAVLLLASPLTVLAMLLLVALAGR